MSGCVKRDATGLPAIHASEAKLMQACPRKWRHAYVEGRVPREKSEALAIGTAVHEWLEGFWTRDPKCYPYHPVARACCAAYQARWQEPPPGNWSVEQKFEGLLGSVPIAGTVDAIGEDPGGHTVIVEHKTTSEDISPGSLYWRKVVTTDIQVSMYLAAFPGAYILYDVIRKPLLRQAKGEPDQKFYERCLAAMSIDPEKHFQRATVVRMQDEHSGFEQDLMSIDRLRHGKDHPRNPSQCFAYGKRCEYWDVCWENGSLSDDTQFQDSDR